MEKAIDTDRGRFTVRTYTPEDEAGVLALWRAAFEKEMDPQLWRWKYLQGPFKNQIAVCTDAPGNILVLYGGIPFRAAWGDQTVRMTQLMDIMSHPSCRGSGLFIRTAEAFFDFFAGAGKTVFYYGFPGAYHYTIGEKYLDYRMLNQGMGFMTAKTADLKATVKPFQGVAEPIQRIDASLDDMWRRERGSYPLSVIRDGRFLHWRFFQHPFNRYELWGFRPFLRRQLKAYAVLSIKGPKARLVDVFAPNSEPIVTGFLSRMAAHYISRDIEEMEVWLPKAHFLEPACIAAGFLPAKEPLGIIPTGRSFDPRLDYDWASENMYYTMADGDLM